MPTTAAQFRKLATSLPDCEPGEHMGHPDFRTAGRVFATLRPEAGTAMVRVPPAAQRRLIAAHEGVCWPASGAWGRGGCTMLELGGIDSDTVAGALQQAWEFAHASTTRARAKK